MNSDPSNPTPSPAQPVKLLTFRSGGWVLLLAGFLSLIAAGLVLLPVWRSGGFHKAIGDGKNADTYGFDLSALTIPKNKLIASGNPKDQIRAIPENLVETITPAEVKLMADNEHIRFLVPADRVIGVVIDGIARAYPLRVLNLHEVVNDKVGSTPLAVTYSPLSDSAVVLDRRIDGPTAPAVEFGVSGLMVDSNTVYFDRRKAASQESLWPQLALKAVSGPLAGKAMTLVPFEVTTWQEWTTAHPDTRVLQGLRSLKTEYGSEPYNVYIASDDLKFAASPYWNVPGVPKKTRIVVTSTDGVKWVALPATYTSTTVKGTPLPPYRVYSYLFAWYAQHPTDTDFSAFDRK